jgi:fatty-acyl-CoA synthase
VLALDALAFHAAQHPAHPALYWRGRWVSYGEASRRADAAAQALAARGVQAGDVVATQLPNHLASFVLAGAAPRLGFALAPLGARWSAHERRDALAQLAPKLVVADADGRRALEAAGFDTTRVVDVDVLPEAPEADLPIPRERVHADATAMLLFTGGTTGTLKAARISHRQLRVNALDTIIAWGLSARDAAIVATPTSHAAVNVLATPLLVVGGRVLVAERFEPTPHLAWVDEHQVTRLFLVPTMYQMLADDPAFATARLDGVVEAIVGGAPCPRAIRDAFAARGVPFRQGYGLTEAGVNCFTMDAAEAAAHPDSVGRPMPDLDVRLVDEHGVDVADDTVGELWLSGPMVMDGYHAQPEATAAVFAHDRGARWLRTGDLARRDAEGRYAIVGRKKEMFISGGENVFPVEVERAILEHPSVAECVVLGVPDPLWGEVGVAWVVARAGAALDPAALRAFLGERLARFKVPKHVRVVDALARTGAGKLDKAALRRAWDAG